MTRTKTAHRLSNKIVSWVTQFKARVEREPKAGPLFVVYAAAAALLSNIIANVLDAKLGSWKAIFVLAVLMLAILGIIVVVAAGTAAGQLPDDLLVLRDFRAQCLNTPELVLAANAISRSVFGAATVPESQVEGILLKNKVATVGLFEKSLEHPTGRLVGYASCWPITREVHTRLRMGDAPGGMSESELSAEHVLADTELQNAEVLFIPAVAVLDRATYRGKLRAAVLACEFLNTSERPTNLLSQLAVVCGSFWSVSRRRVDA